MSPSEPPVSIYGTLPRSVGKIVRAPLDNSPLSSHYATFRKEKLGPRTSLKLMAMMKEGANNKAEDTRSIISGFTEGSSKGEERMRQGVSFNRLPLSPRSQDVEVEEQEEDESTVEPSTAWGWAGRVVARYQTTITLSDSMQNSNVKPLIFLSKNVGQFL